MLCRIVLYTLSADNPYSTTALASLRYEITTCICWGVHSLRVVNPKGEALPWGPMEDLGRMIFHKKISLGSHMFIK